MEAASVFSEDRVAADRDPKVYAEMENTKMPSTSVTSESHVERALIDDTRLARALAEGVAAWLTFEFHAQRGRLFSEQYMGTAVGQILLGYAGGQRISGEITHPLLKQPDRGRPYQLDYLVGDPARPTLVVETKWASWSIPSVDAIVADLIRLSLVSQTYDITSIFLLAGQKKQSKN